MLFNGTPQFKLSNNGQWHETAQVGLAFVSRLHPFIINLSITMYTL